MWSSFVGSFMFFINFSYHAVVLVLKSVHSKFLCFILSPHSEDGSLLLSCSFVLHKDTGVRSVEHLASL